MINAIGYCDIRYVDSLSGLLKYYEALMQRGGLVARARPDSGFIEGGGNSRGPQVRPDLCRSEGLGYELQEQEHRASGRGAAGNFDQHQCPSE